MKTRGRRNVTTSFIIGNGGDNLTIAVAFGILIVTPILLINFANLSLLGLLMITAFTTLFGTYIFAQWIGHLRDREYQRECRSCVKFNGRKKRSLHNVTKDNLSERAIDNLVRSHFRKH